MWKLQLHRLSKLCIRETVPFSWPFCLGLGLSFSFVFECSSFINIYIFCWLCISVGSASFLCSGPLLPTLPLWILCCCSLWVPSPTLLLVRVLGPCPSASVSGGCDVLWAFSLSMALHTMYKTLKNGESWESFLTGGVYLDPNLLRKPLHIWPWFILVSPTIRSG